VEKGGNTRVVKEKKCGEEWREVEEEEKNLLASTYPDDAPPFFSRHTQLL
jgi:hypothetical protein